jgi:hypothetical protein
MIGKTEEEKLMRKVLAKQQEDNKAAKRLEMTLSIKEAEVPLLYVCIYTYMNT